ncbi:GntR family transcriptional regulator [Desulfosarcina widdelii]|uniref:GntR family transcriptional regulator n=1 Tax=Desulfosarcina widdelii TaxID=947919 RepID=A0A5K7ZFK5_9BACT|nr:GntR family transcriptional regulator [Desulfosarcina widdelii]BBO78581.1 GntR family transcriptional regulator [Desulfosarcina widdelii]
MAAKDRHENAYDAIKELLFRRVINPGQKLPYKDLCQLIGLSKTPIINALNRLVYEGFVSYEPNKGYRITPIDEKSISHLFEIRLELECLNVRNAVKNFTPEGYAKLQERYNQLQGYTPEFTDRKKLSFDMEVHLEIARMGGNPYSLTFLKTVLEHIFFMYQLERGVERRKEKIEYEHSKVVENIGKQDIVAAEKHMRKHIEALHRLMLDYLKELKQNEENFWV